MVVGSNSVVIFLWRYFNAVPHRTTDDLVEMNGRQLQSFSAVTAWIISYHTHWEKRTNNLFTLIYSYLPWNRQRTCISIYAGLRSLPVVRSVQSETCLTVHSIYGLLTKTRSGQSVDRDGIWDYTRDEAEISLKTVEGP
jgi:hypothetical protein